MEIKKNIFQCIRFLLALFFVSIVCGCGVKSVPKLLVAPEIIYCFDTVGHKEGARPFIQGGTCCCTPSVAVLEDYKTHRYYGDDFTVEDLINEYKRAGIITALDLRYSNNFDSHAPHVVFGGTSMVPPTPGTQNYEDVLFGKKREFKIKRKSLRRITNEK
jgi:hypothetical protein